MKFAAIRIQSDEFHVSWMCRLLQVSRSGYYAWLRRKPSRRERDDRRLSVKIVASFRANRGVYGSPRVVDELRADGESVGRRRVARIMRENGLCARLPRRFRKTTDSSHSRPVARDLVQRQFLPKTPNEVWAADISVPQQAAREMGVGPPESPCRRRFQTTVSGCGQKPWS